MGVMACQWCRAVFIRRGSVFRRFCSVKCRGAESRSLLCLPCDGCGEPFETKGKYLGKSRYFCSQACWCRTRRVSQRHRRMVYLKWREVYMARHRVRILEAGRIYMSKVRYGAYWQAYRTWLELGRQLKKQGVRK